VKLFGKVVSFEYSEVLYGTKLYGDDKYHLITFIYNGEFSGRDKPIPIHVEITLINDKLWVSSYMAFPEEWTFNQNISQSD